MEVDSERETSQVPRTRSSAREVNDSAPSDPESSIASGLMDSGDDERLTDYDGEDGISEGGVSAVSGDIDWTRRILLQSGHCRVRTQIKQPSGARMGCVCGRLEEDCKRHRVQRRANPRFPEGYYLAVVSVENHVHGKIGTHLTVAQYQEMRAEEAAFMAADVEAQQDGDSPTEEAEVADLRRANTGSVSFGGETTTAGGGTASDSEYHDTFQGTMLDFQNHPKDAHTSDRRGGGSTPLFKARSFWYGLTDLVGERWITNDREESEFMVKSANFAIQKVFYSKLLAEQWQKANKPEAMPETVSIVDSSDDEEELRRVEARYQEELEKIRKKKAHKALKQAQYREACSSSGGSSPEGSSGSTSEDTSTSSESDPDSSESSSEQSTSSESSHGRPEEGPQTQEEGQATHQEGFEEKGALKTGP